MGKIMTLLTNRLFGLLAILCLALASWSLGRLNFLATALFAAGLILCCVVILKTEDPKE